jgi:hypothetical protein
VTVVPSSEWWDLEVRATESHERIPEKSTKLLSLSLSFGDVTDSPNDSVYPRFGSYDRTQREG